MIQSVQKPLPWWQQSAPPPMPGTEEDPTQPPAPPLSRFDMPDEPQQAQQGFMPEMPQWQQPQVMASAATQGMPDEPGTAPAPAPAPVAPPVQQEPDPNAMGRDPVRRARMIGALEGADEEARAQKPATGIGQGIAQQARDRAIQKYITDHEKKSSGWDIARQAIGAAMQISPRLSGVGHVLMHPPNKTEESIPVLESAAKQEELQQQAISGEAVKRSQIAANEAWHDASIAEKEAALKKPPTVAELAAMKHPDGTPVFSKDQIAIIASGGHLQQKTESAQMQLANLASPEAIERAAERLVRYGEAPQGGRGGTGFILKVHNRAAELAKEMGISTSEAQLWQTQQKADAADMVKLQSQRDLVLSAENTASKNLDIALQNSHNVDRSGSPIINKIILWAKGEAAGDDDTSLFQNSIETAAGEYAKVITNATSGPVTDAARASTSAMLRAALADGTFTKVVAQMKQEMGNRREGYDQQLKEISSRVGASLNDKKPKPGEAPAPTAPPPLAKDTVNLQAPDGTVKPVPLDQVEHYLKLGAKRVP